MKFIRITIIVAAAAAVFNAGAELDIETNLSGYASLEEGQIVQGTYTGSKVLRSDHVLVQRMYSGLGLEVRFNPLPASGRVGIEMRMSNEYPRDFQDKGTTRRLYFYPYLTELDFTYALGERDNPLFTFTAGYFPIKYNQDARNLGEYLFRSGTYPQYLVTDFDFPAMRLVGLNAQANPFEGLTLNGLAYTNIEWQAVGDLNVAGLISYNFADILEVGAGANYASLVSADRNFTSLHNPFSTDFVDAKGDTGYYTFEGTKLMARMSIDPKKLLPLEIFGREDLKVYGEAAVLGLKDYPISTDSITRYDSIHQRIPLMFGINLPAFNFLDVFSVQGQWFGSRYPNDMGAVVFENAPIPVQGDKKSQYKTNRLTNMYIDDDWKWSMYAKRTIAGHFGITMQVASDHLRWFSQDWTRQDFEEALRKPNQFYYVCKLGYTF